MGMCAIRGLRVLHDEVEESDLNTPRSSTTSSTCGYGSGSSQELDRTAEAAGQFYHDSALWQRTIPRGRRCKPLSFSGVILYDRNGNQLSLPRQVHEDQEDEEYYSPHPKNLAEREAEFWTR